MNKKTNIGQKGFTLTEVLVSLTIVMGVIAALVGIQIMIRNSYNFSFNTTLAVDHADRVVKDLSRELREARTGDNGAYPLEIADDYEIAFYADVDEDDDTERVRYFLVGSTLSRGVTQPEGDPVAYPTTSESIKELTTYVQDSGQPIFYYYNQDWPEDITNNPLPAGNRLSVTQFVKIVINTNVNSNRSSGDYKLEPFVQLRNLKRNL